MYENLSIEQDLNNKSGSRFNKEFTVQAVLGYKFRDEGAPHDCLTDAIIPMRIVLHVLEHRLKGRVVIQESEVWFKISAHLYNLL